MKKSKPTYFIVCLFLGMVYHSMSCLENVTDSMKKQLIIKTINEELKFHPKATLLDLYKNFFQGKFGPGHMIEDLNASTDYFMRELEQATEFDSTLWQAVGYEQHYYRVNLSLVRDGKISKDQLITAFTESANKAKPPSLETWKKEWNVILKIIEQMGLKLTNFENDKLQIAENLKEGIVVGHHSSIYRNSYHPHYRIVSKTHFEKLYKLVKNN